MFSFLGCYFCPAHPRKPEDIYCTHALGIREMPYSEAVRSKGNGTPKSQWEMLVCE
jgi:hypothetical protein